MTAVIWHNFPFQHFWVVTVLYVFLLWITWLFQPNLSCFIYLANLSTYLGITVRSLKGIKCTRQITETLDYSRVMWSRQLSEEVEKAK